MKYSFEDILDSDCQTYFRHKNLDKRVIFKGGLDCNGIRRIWVHLPDKDLSYPSFSIDSAEVYMFFKFFNLNPNSFVKENGIKDRWDMRLKEFLWYNFAQFKKEEQRTYLDRIRRLEMEVKELKKVDSDSFIRYLHTDQQVSKLFEEAKYYTDRRVKELHNTELMVMLQQLMTKLKDVRAE